MPPEWHPHAGTWLAWPRNGDTWPRNLSLAQQEFIQLAVAIARDEPVNIVAAAEYHPKIHALLRGHCTEPLPIALWPIATNDAWIRDYGPTFVSDGSKLSAVNWRYNAWGGKYPPFEDDQLVVERIRERWEQFNSDQRPERIDSQLCIEGGALEVDANGVLICTKTCALDKNRNPGWTADAVEQEFKRCLGVSQIIWLHGDAIAGDDTDGHIDQLARFAPENRILYAWTKPDDPQYSGLKKNLDDLQRELERIGGGYELIPLLLPEPVFNGSQRLPASYCNFYITNRSVIVPAFDQPDSDERAAKIIGELFVDRRVVILTSLHLSSGLGSFHCLTQQQPTI
jgi:agmatine deiminase